MTSVPAGSSRKIIKRPNTSLGGVLVSLVTNVWTEEAHTPPARVTVVANSAKAPVINPPPIHTSGRTVPGLSLIHI